MNNRSLAKMFIPFTLLLAACTGPTSQKIVPAEFQAGQISFHKVCAGCHGVDAMGTTKAPNLIHAKYSKDSFSNNKIVKVIINGSQSGAMPAQKRKVTEEDIKQIIKYLRYSQKDIEASKT